MSVEQVTTYTCDECEKKATKHKKGEQWFRIEIKVHFGADAKDQTVKHVCCLKCAHDAMVHNKDTICIEWVKMEKLFH